MGIEESNSNFYLEQETMCLKFIEFVELIVKISEIEDSSIFCKHTQIVEEFINESDMNNFAYLKIIIHLFQNSIPPDKDICTVGSPYKNIIFLHTNI